MRHLMRRRRRSRRRGATCPRVAEEQSSQAVLGLAVPIICDCRVHIIRFRVANRCVTSERRAAKISSGD